MQLWQMLFNLNSKQLSSAARMIDAATNAARTNAAKTIAAARMIAWLISVRQQLPLLSGRRVWKQSSPA